MADGGDRPDALRTRLPTLVLLTLALVACAWGLGRALAWRVGLQVVLGAWLWAVLAGLAVALALVLGAAAQELRELARGSRRARPLAPTRKALVVAVLAWLLFLALVQPFQRLWLELALAGAAGAWAAWLVAERRAHEPARPLRAVELALFTLAATAVGLELGLRVLAAVRSQPLLARVDEAPARFIERFRCRPGEVRFGSPCNARGYYDGPLTPRAEGERLVVAIGDSFNVGVVPHAWHYTTVCEEALGVPVHNLGVAGIGPPEYAHLLVTEALPLDPSVVVVSLFVGNDLAYADVREGLPDGWLRAFCERERVLLWVVPQRLARLAAERARRGADDVAVAQGQRVGPARPDRETQLATWPWLADPLLEQGALSPEAFGRLEARRARAVCRGEPPAWDSVRRHLLAMRAAAGETPLVVVLVPAEFQVEDALWAEVSAAAGVALQRDLPQRLLGEWLAREGIACLDLLAELRAVEPLADGRRHVYHLRDTHFNARGNAVAGAALAEFLRPLLGR